jgi:diguanylate cyclase (GGDEF)-like protein
MHNLSTRARIALLVILSALPALLFSIYNGVERRSQAELSARENLKRLAALAAKQQEEMIEGVRQLLFAVAPTAESLKRDPRSCQEFFKRLVEASGGLYHSMGVHDADGNLICNAVSWEGSLNIKDRRYFRLTAEGRKFSIGEYQVGRVTGQAGINFGYPILDGERKVTGVVFAGLNLGKLNEQAAKTPLPEGGRLTIFDRNGTILMRQPADTGRVGEKTSNARLIESLQTEKDQLFEAHDTDGVRRIYAVERVGINPDGSVPLRTVISIPRQVILAEANRALVQTILGILGVTLILVVGAWYGAEVAVVRRIRSMLNVAHRIRAGDLTARTGFQVADEELAQLGNALDDMAQSLHKRDAELKQVLRELSEQVITDPLTGLNNRRYLWDFLRRDLLRARRAVLPVAAIMFDIDHFKRLNDTWGHEAGDMVLKAAADVTRQNVRGSDIACRYGGEEFMVILPEATLPVAIERAEKIRRGIEQMEITFGGKRLDTVTASFGIALYPTHANDDEALLRAADEALYLAKKNGRNRVQVYNAAPSVF